MSTRIREVAAELRAVIRYAARDPEALEGELPRLTALHRVASTGDLDEAARVHLVLHRLVPEYLDRLPTGRDCRAIRELLTWEDADGEAQSLTTRYHKAAAHLVNAAADFGRRQEPRLLLECARRFVVLDHEDRHADGVGEAAAPPPGPLSAPGGPPLVLGVGDEAEAGIVGVHKTLDYDLLIDAMDGADEIIILNTWIPGLDILADALVDALGRGTYVSILMLYPDSDIAQLRSRALQASTQSRFRDDRVRPGVRHCLDVLAAIARAIDDDARRALRVRLYDSLPSIAVHAVDDRMFVSFFLHGHLAVKSVQLEVEGPDTLMGRLVSRELRTLWELAHEIRDLDRWEAEVEQMDRSFDAST